MCVLGSTLVEANHYYVKPIRQALYGDPINDKERNAHPPRSTAVQENGIGLDSLRS